MPDDARFRRQYSLRHDLASTQGERSYGRYYKYHQGAKKRWHLRVGDNGKSMEVAIRIGIVTRLVG